MNYEQLNQKYAFITPEQSEFNKKQYLEPLKNLETLTYKEFLKIKSHINPIMLSQDESDKRKFYLFGKGGMKEYWDNYKKAKAYLIDMQTKTLEVFNQNLNLVRDENIESFKKEVEESRFLFNKHKLALVERAQEQVEEKQSA